MDSCNPNEVLYLDREHPDFPPELAAISDAPAEIYLRGKMPPHPRVAVVGSRDADDYGLGIAKQLGAELGKAGVCVVSGGASGIDTAALEGCREGCGRPMAVLGTGVDIAYPVSNRALFDWIATVGSLVSEYPPGTRGHPGRFPRRNRIVSGLADAVIVVRAALKSGSLITAHEARKQGRLLMAVPGRALERLSAGVHQLIREGATLVECGQDILHALAIDSPSQSSLNLQVAEVNLNERERLLLAALGDGPRAIDTLTTGLRLESHEVASLLLQMELRGLVVQKPGMIYALTPQSLAIKAKGERGA